MSLKDNLSGVTVDGIPAVEYIAKTQPKRVRNKAFTNGISRNLNLPEKDEPDFTQWVLINGVQYLRAAKEPFEKSGYGLKGAILYDPDSGKIKCNERSEWCVSYGSHRAGKKQSKLQHPTAMQYRELHGLSASTPLAGLKYRRQVSEQSIARNSAANLNIKETAKAIRIRSPRKPRARTIEWLNAKSDCPLQLPERMKMLVANLGRVPTYAEMSSAKMSPRTISYIFGSMDKFLVSCGLQPRPRGDRVTGAQRLSDQEMLNRLTAYRKIYGRWPHKRESSQGFIPDYNTYRRRFGSWPQAIAKAESRLSA